MDLELEYLGNHYENIQIGGNARVMLGNEYHGGGDIAAWLSCSLDQRFKHSEAFSCYVGDTFDWVLRDATFVTWQKRQIRTLWCLGPMGTGKTVLTSAVVEHLKGSVCSTNSMGVAVFYCQHTLQDKQTLVAILGSLLAQLYQQHSEGPRAPPKVRLAFNESFAAKSNGSPNPPLLQDIKCWFQEECSRWNEVFISLDGLDESNPDLRAELLDFLQCFEMRNLHLYLASRDIPDIRELLHNPAILRMENKDESLERVIRSRLDSPPGQRFLRRIEEKGADLSDVTNRILDRVSRIADGMYLLAHLSLDRIFGSRTLCEVHKCLDSLPPTLEQHFDDTWSRIICQRDSRDVEYAKMALLLIVFTGGQLEWSALQRAIYTTSGGAGLPAEPVYNSNPDLLSVADIMSVCHGLLADPNVSRTDPLYDEQGAQRVMFCHFSAMEYFYSRRHTYFPEGDRKLVHACIKYLKLGATGIRLYLQHPLRLIGINSPRSHIYGLEEYAHFDDHANQKFSEIMLDRYPPGSVMKNDSVSCVLPGFSILEQLAECWEKVLPFDSFLRHAMNSLWRHSIAGSEDRHASIQVILLLPELYCFASQSSMLPRNLTTTDFRPEFAETTTSHISSLLDSMASFKASSKLLLPVEERWNPDIDSLSIPSLTSFERDSMFHQRSELSLDIFAQTQTAPTSITSSDELLAQAEHVDVKGRADISDTFCEYGAEEGPRDQSLASAAAGRSERDISNENTKRKKRPRKELSSTLDTGYTTNARRKKAHIEV